MELPIVCKQPNFIFFHSGFDLLINIYDVAA